MSGEINGTNALLLQSDGSGNYTSIIGQIELTSTIGGTPINVSTKSNDDWVALIDGELAGKGAQITGSLSYNSSSSYRNVRSLQRSHQIADFKLSFNETNEVDLYVSGVVNGLSDSAPTGDRLTTAFNITSTSDIYRAIPAFIDGEVALDADGKERYVRV